MDDSRIPNDNYKTSNDRFTKTAQKANKINTANSKFNFN